MSGAFFLTTPIYYANGDPHIGHTYATCVADALARYHRLLGDRTFLLSGSDEHGEKPLELARERGMSPAEITTHYSQAFRRTWEELGVSLDRFIRTTEERHEQIVRDVLQRVYDQGQIEFREYEGLYCVGCERFLTERDMVEGLCVDHERAPEHRAESNYFFKMSEHFDWLHDLIEANPELIRPERFKNEALALLREETGLGDLCISRPKDRLDWGIELPFDRDYVCYVWFDALISYLTGIGYPEGEDFADLWANGEHLIGKDILKPHAIFWPIMLKSMGLPVYRHLNVHGHWQVDDRKVSKTLGNMISPLIMRDKYGFESFRYYLLREMAFGLDANFSEGHMITRVNADLANNLGNLVSRTLNMTGRFADGRVPAPGDGGELEAGLRRVAEEAYESLDQHMRRCEPNRAIEAAFRVVDEANRYLERREPWKAAKDPALAEQVRTTLATCCEALRVSAILLSPFLPEATREILSRLGLADALATARLPEAAAWGETLVGLETTVGPALFPRIEVDAA